MASSYNDKNNPNACIYGKILGGGKIKSWRLNANSYKIQKFKCNVEKECKEEHKKFITEGYFNNYYPLNGEIGSSLNGERGIIIFVEKSYNLDLHSKKHERKYSNGHQATFWASGKHVMCYFEIHYVGTKAIIQRAEYTKQ